jgi:ubiquinone/menaquinone biosynthesis C-methylase UbiE
MGKRTFDDFDEFALDYRSIHNKNIQLSGADSYYFADYKIKYLQEFESNIKQQILDVGSGDGAVENFIQKYFPLWETIGIDISSESIAVAKSRNLSNSNFKLFDGINLPFENESFDVVFIANVLHHVKFEDHAYLLGEIKRVLKPKGRLYIFEHNPKNPFTRHLVNTCIFDENAVLLKSKYLKSQLEDLEFKIQYLHYILFFPRNRIFSMLHNLEKYLRKIPYGAQYFTVAIK